MRRSGRPFHGASSSAARASANEESARRKGFDLSPGLLVGGDVVHVSLQTQPDCGSSVGMSCPVSLIAARRYIACPSGPAAAVSCATSCQDSRISSTSDRSKVSAVLTMTSRQLCPNLAASSRMSAARTSAGGVGERWSVTAASWSRSRSGAHPHTVAVSPTLPNASAPVLRQRQNDGGSAVARLVYGVRWMRGADVFAFTDRAHRAGGPAL